MTPIRTWFIAFAIFSADASLPANAVEAVGPYTYSNLAVRDGVCGVFEAGTESQFPAAIKLVIDTRPNDHWHAPRGTLIGCHSVSHLQSCEDEHYYCFRTTATHFAVPKERGLRVGQRWETMANKFEVIRTEDLTFFGTHFKTFVIATPNKQDGTTYFYWSEDAGLVAMRDLMRLNGEESVEASVLEGAKGFPF
ncbi:hypothetical protein AB4059_05715 [Lysobacter sp. 2RAF19]